MISISRRRTGLFTVVLLLTTFALVGSAQIQDTGKKGGGGGGGGGVSHTARQARPIKLGTSGGNASDNSNGFCCSGTLGALVQIGSTQYILSNSHVFAGDTVLGGNNRVAAIGDPIDQPGLVDVSCQDISADHVAKLSSLSAINPIPKGIDAAVAEVIPGMVDPTGAILEIGTISTIPVAALPGQAVKKSGRTTGLTRSSVDAVNATVTVRYTYECAGSAFTTTFSGQILVKNKGSRFLDSGDSGSLLVEDVATNPRPVGLLFAGGSSIAVANPIGDVLSAFPGASMVGAAGSAGATTISTSDQQLQRNVAQAMRTQRANAGRLAAIPMGVGHAVGIGPSGVHLKILVERLTPEALRAAPQQLDGFPVVVEEVGQIIAY